MFDIREHFDKLDVVRETDSYAIAICPICGSNNLKINKDNAAYQCWTCESISEIRNAISPTHKNSYKAKLPKITDVFVPRKSIKLKPLPVIKPKGLIHLYTSSCSLNLEAMNLSKVDFYYSSTQKICRSKLETGKKQLFCAHKTSKGWVWGKGLAEWDWFNWNVVSKYKKLQPSANAIVACEGEKVALTLLRAGIVAISPPGHSWKENWLRSAIKKLKELGFVHITYFTDHDEAGLKKLELFRTSAFFENVSFSVINLTNHFEHLQLTDDFVDLNDNQKKHILNILLDG